MAKAKKINPFDIGSFETMMADSHCGDLNNMPKDQVVYFDTFEEDEIVVTQAPWPEEDAEGSVWLLMQHSQPFAVAGSREAAIKRAINLADGWGVWCYGPDAGKPVIGIGIRPVR